MSSNANAAAAGDSQDFSAHRLLDAFQSSIVYDDKETACDVRLKEYVTAYEEILKFFNYLGTVFYFAEVDIKAKLVLLNGHLASNDENYTTVLKIATHEKEKELYKVRGGNASRHILRLHRALEFIYKFLEELFNSNHSAKSSTICSEIYHKTLAKHHTWLVRQAVSLGVLTLPTHEVLLSHMCRNEEDREKFPLFINSVNTVYNVMQEIYERFQFLELP